MENPLKLPYIANNPDIEIGWHAIAIDERRAFFRSHLWRRPADHTVPHGPRDVKQVWFPGVHCDVGGGYPEGESGLSKIALEWMLDEAGPVGLLVDQRKRREMLAQTGGGRYVRPDSTAMAHESLAGGWHIAEFLPKKHYDSKTGKETRRMNLYRRRTISSQALVHHSAFERGDIYRARLPTDAIRVDGKQVGAV